MNENTGFKSDPVHVGSVKTNLSNGRPKFFGQPIDVLLA